MARIVLILALIHSLFHLSHARYSIDPLPDQSNSSIETLFSNKTNSTLLDPEEDTRIEPIDLAAEEETADLVTIDQDHHGDEWLLLDEIPISSMEVNQVIGRVSKEEEIDEGKGRMRERNKKVEDSDSDSDSDSDDEEEEEESMRKKKSKGGFLKWFWNLVYRF